MKKLLLALLILATLATTVIIATKAENSGVQNDYLRIHVRANSNGADDQNVKYKVKDAVVEFVTPYCAGCVDKQTAIEIMSGILPQIEQVCDRVLKENGYTYTSRAQIRSEKFPTRVYGELTLKEGVYDALIIELGTGAGDNWWCVIYPPLCFTSATADVKYRSAIQDIINKFFN